MKLFSLLFFLFLFQFSLAQENDSTKMINEALLKAKQENKHVFINYYSTNCRFSKKMKKKMSKDSFKKLFSTNYIIVDIFIPKK